MKNLLVYILLCVMPISVSAQEVSSEELYSMGHTIWIAVCCILVFIMQLGFLFVESGMVRSKNTVNVIMKNFTDIGFGVLGFWIFGYGLMFGLNESGWIGTSDFLPNFDSNKDNMNLVYQMMFAATAATIVSGAVAERFKFTHYLAGAFLLTTIIYPIFGSWVWGGTEENPGWLASLGFYDSAGGTVVHGIGAWTALGALLVLGPRHGRYSRKGALHEIPGHNLPYISVGGFLLWFGWFGFNGGSVNEDFSNLGQILLVTHMGAIGGICGAIFWMLATRQKVKMTHTVNGALAGLVSITAGVDVLSVSSGLITAVIGGIILVASTNFLHRWKIDDVVGAIPVHGFCGAWGTFAVGLFYQGDMFNVERIAAQSIGVIVAFIWAVSLSLALYWGLNRLTNGLRVNTKFEQRGLDLSEHHEVGYGEFMNTPINASATE